MEKLLAEQQRATEAILSLVDTLKNQQITPVRPLENSLENSGKPFSKREIEIKAVAAPSKMQLAIEWLRGHPEDVGLTGRELKDLRKPMGIEISHKTWNDAKKELAL